MSTQELLHWWRYYNESPFGYMREDYRQALNCAVVAAPHTKKSLPLSAFLLVPEEKKEPTPEELAKKVHTIFGGFLNGGET